MHWSISRTLLVVLAVDLLATSGDITMTWTSPVYPKLKSKDTSQNPLGRPITENEDAWLGSLINVGAMVGPFPYGYLAERFGRRAALLAVAVPHIVAYLTFAFATDINLFYFGRLLGGLAVGGGYTLMPMYVAEVTEDATRGVMSATLNVFWTIGNLIPNAVGSYLSIRWFNVGLACVPCAFFVSFLLLAPESPYHLVAKGDAAGARRALMTLRSAGEDAADKEVEQIRLTLQRHEHGSVWDIFRTAALRKALAYSLVLIALNQFGGINAISFYLQPILEAAGGALSADVASGICGACTVLGSVTLLLLAERAGRKTLLSASAFACSVALALVGAYFFLLRQTDFDMDTLSWLPVTSVALFMFTYNSGISALPWVVSAELFPNKVKGVSATTVSCVCWALSFLLTQFFNDMNHAMTEAGTFWFFAGCCVAGGLFCVFLLPETKGKSFDEIQDLL